MTLGRRGNNPFCYHRVVELRKKGVRERLVQKERAPGEPYDSGRFELAEEPWPKGGWIAAGRARPPPPPPPLRRPPKIGVDPPSGFAYRICTMKAPAASACAPSPGEGCCPPADEQPDLRPVEGEGADEELAALAKAIGHPARVQILRLLVRRSACVCGDIVDELPLAQSTVSQHLKVLKEAGLIRGDVDGPRVCYCIEPRALRRFKALVGGL